MKLCLWACTAFAAVLMASQTAHSTLIFADFFQGALNSLSSLNGGADTTSSEYLAQAVSTPLPELGIIIGKIIMAAVATYLGLVLIARLLISRAIETLLDS